MTFSDLWTQIAAQDAVEWTGLITGLLYVMLASYEKPSCWIFGIASCACIAWKSFFEYRLMADVGLQTFYVVIGFVGLRQWMRSKKEGMKPVITSAINIHLFVILLILAISYPFSWVLVHYADARYGYPDTALTLLSVWATILLVRKDLHNWIYWIIIDIAYTGLYVRSEGFLFALLYLIYAFVSVWGFWKWRLNSSIMMNN